MRRASRTARRLAAACAVTLMGARGGCRLEGQPGETGVVVFSKDRPAQLEALLRSADEFLRGGVRRVVLWRADLAGAEEAYREALAPRERGGLVHVRESAFRTDLIAALHWLRGCRAVMFLVDDLLFVRPFDTRTLAGADLRRCVPSLRLGPQIRFCQPKGMVTPPPALSPSEFQGWLGFSWTEAEGDWAMPLSVDGHVFPLDEIRLLARLADYRAPNSFEEALGDFRFLYKHRRGLCLEHPALVNFAFNRVQTENRDFPCGELDPAEFLRRWQEGWRLDIRALAETGRGAAACHLVTEPVFERRFSGAS